MIRVRRRFAIMLCGISVAIFLTVYFMINYAAPQEDKKPNFMALENNIDNKQVQKPDLNNGGHSRSRNMDSGVLTNGQRSANNAINKDEEYEEKKHVIPKPDDVHKDNVDENVIARDETCEFDPQQVPQPEIQVRIIYEHELFRNDLLVSVLPFLDVRHVWEDVIC